MLLAAFFVQAHPSAAALHEIVTPFIWSTAPTLLRAKPSRKFGTFFACRIGYLRLPDRTVSIGKAWMPVQTATDQQGISKVAEFIAPQAAFLPLAGFALLSGSRGFPHIDPTPRACDMERAFRHAGS
jgi:hypothetical protein